MINFFKKKMNYFIKHQINFIKGTVRDIQVSNSGKVIAVCSNDKTVLFDISELPDKAPKLIQTPQQVHPNCIETLSFSSDNLLLASAGKDTSLIICKVIEQINNNKNNLSNGIIQISSPILI